MNQTRAATRAAFTRPEREIGEDLAVHALAIDGKGLAVSIGGRNVWDHLDVTVEAGEFVAVLGPNGAGKSTLVKAVLGLIPVTEGELRVLDGPPGVHNASVGYLPQRRSFDPSLRVRGVDVVRLGLDGDRWGLPLPWPTASRRAAEQRVAEVIALVGATAFADRPRFAEPRWGCRTTGSASLMSSPGRGFPPRPPRGPGTRPGRARPGSGSRRGRPSPPSPPRGRCRRRVQPPRPDWADPGCQAARRGAGVGDAEPAPAR